MKFDVNTAAERLSVAEEFSDGWTGWGKPTWQALAFTCLFDDDHAVELFEGLVRNGDLAGQLYGLCGLHLISREKFTQVVSRYRDSTESVTLQTGDLKGTSTAADIVGAIDHYSRWLLTYARSVDSERRSPNTCPHCDGAQTNTIEEFGRGGSHWCKEARAYVFVCSRCNTFYTVKDGGPIIRARASCGAGTHDCHGEGGY